MCLMDLCFILLRFIIAPIGPVGDFSSHGAFSQSLCPADTFHISSQCQGRFACKRSDQTVPLFWGPGSGAIQSTGSASDLHFSSGKMGDEHHELLHKALKLAGKPGRFLSKVRYYRWKQTIWHQSSMIKQCQEYMVRTWKSPDNW